MAHRLVALFLGLALVGCDTKKGSGIDQAHQSVAQEQLQEEAAAQAMFHAPSQTPIVNTDPLGLRQQLSKAASGYKSHTKDDAGLDDYFFTKPKEVGN